MLVNQLTNNYLKVNKHGHSYIKHVIQRCVYSTFKLILLWLKTFKWSSSQLWGWIYWLFGLELKLQPCQYSVSLWCFQTWEHLVVLFTLLLVNNYLWDLSCWSGNLERFMLGYGSLLSNKSLTNQWWHCLWQWYSCNGLLFLILWHIIVTADGSVCSTCVKIILIVESIHLLFDQ